MSVRPVVKAKGSARPVVYSDDELFDENSDVQGISGGGDDDEEEEEEETHELAVSEEADATEDEEEFLAGPVEK